jgi:hypothetical protein
MEEPTHKKEAKKPGSNLFELGYVGNSLSLAYCNCRGKHPGAQMLL